MSGHMAEKYKLVYLVSKYTDNKIICTLFILSGYIKPNDQTHVNNKIKEIICRFSSICYIKLIWIFDMYMLFYFVIIKYIIFDTIQTVTVILIAYLNTQSHQDNNV